MIKAETLFIVGAGASYEFKLPIGRGLVEQIAAVLQLKGSSSTTNFIVEALQIYCSHHKEFQINSLAAKARFLSSALTQAQSIDTFVDNHRHDAEITVVAKHAIAACILDKERDSYLHLGGFDEPSKPVDFGAARETWLGRLWTIMVDGASAKAPEAIFEHIAFIVFNYDRCLEQFFIHSLRNYFGLQVEDARVIVARHLRVIHPYGLLEPLGHNTPYGWDFRKYGAAGHRLYEMARNIRTFSEVQADKGEEAQIKQWVSAADRLIFLGFGFHQQNVTLLSPTPLAISTRANGQQVRATTYGLSESNRQYALRDIGQILRDANAHNYVDPLNGTCAELIDSEYLFFSR